VSHGPARRELRCWECEVEVESAVGVTLPVPALDRSIFTLCSACVRNVLTPLVEGLGEGRTAGWTPGVAASSVAR
jgi:hypothetical protein